MGRCLRPAACLTWSLGRVAECRAFQIAGSDRSHGGPRVITCQSPVSNLANGL